MVVEPGPFLAAIGYVSGFAPAVSPVVFTPQGRMVRVSVAHDHRYAEYWMDAVTPLPQRFAIRLQTLPAIATELGEDRLVVTLGSAAKFQAGSRVWRINLLAKSEDGRPELKIQDSLAWDNSLPACLGFAKQATAPQRTKLAMDCVCLEWRSDRRCVFGASDQILMACLQFGDTGRTGVTALLVHRRDVPLVQATCLSGGAVRIHMGVRHFSVNCGKRMAVFPANDGKFPPVAELVREARSLGRNRGKAAGFASVTANQLRHCVRQGQIVSDSITLRTTRNRLIVSSEADGSQAEAELSDRCDGNFTPTSLQAAQVRRMALAWPGSRIDIATPGPGLPIVFREASKGRELVSLVVPRGSQA